MAGKLAFLMLSGEIESLTAAAMLASISAQTGDEVMVFVGMNAILAFKKDVVENRDFLAEGPVGEGIKKSTQVPLFTDMLKQGKEIGDLKVYACAMTLDMLGLKKEDLVDVFDDIVGVTKFLDMSKDAKIFVF